MLTVVRGPGRFEPSAGEVARQGVPRRIVTHVGAFCGAGPRSDDVDRPPPEREVKTPVEQPAKPDQQNQQKPP